MKSTIGNNFKIPAPESAGAGKFGEFMRCIYCGINASNIKLEGQVVDGIYYLKGNCPSCNRITWHYGYNGESLYLKEPLPYVWKRGHSFEILQTVYATDGKSTFKFNPGDILVYDSAIKTEKYDLQRSFQSSVGIVNFYVNLGGNIRLIPSTLK